MKAAFQTLKERLSHPFVLAFSSFEDCFQVETDDSSDAVGAMLLQKKAEEKMYSVCLASRTMISAELNYSTFERKELEVFSL